MKSLVALLLLAVASPGLRGDEATERARVALSLAAGPSAVPPVVSPSLPPASASVVPTITATRQPNAAVCDDCDKLIAEGKSSSWNDLKPSSTTKKVVAVVPFPSFPEEGGPDLSPLPLPSAPVPIPMARPVQSCPPPPTVRYYYQPQSKAPKMMPQQQPRPPMVQAPMPMAPTMQARPMAPMMAAPRSAANC